MLPRSARRDGERVCAKPLDTGDLADPVAAGDHSVSAFGAPLLVFAQLLLQVVAAEGRRVGAKLSANCCSPFGRAPPAGTSAMLELALLAMMSRTLFWLQ